MENDGNDSIGAIFELYRDNRRINRVDLTGKVFHKKDLSKIHVENSSFQSSDFSEAILRESRLTNCDFKRASLFNANLVGSVIRLCNLSAVNAKCVNLERAVIEDSQIEIADFSKAILNDTKLTDTSWARSSLCDIVLNGAEGESVCFRGADLSNATLIDARFIDADFRGADLSGANLSNGDFTGADFRGAILENVLWDGACVLGAMFDRGFEMRTVQGASKGNDTARKNDVSEEELAHAIEKVVSGIFSKTVETFKHNSELKDAVGKIDRWNTQKNKTDIETISGLVDQLENAFSGSNTIPPEALSSLKSVVHGLNDTNAHEPSDEIRQLLQKFFPEIKEGKTESLDQIVSKYLSIFNK